MRVFICLTVFTADIEKYANSFVLLKDDDILIEEMVNDSPSSFSIIERIMHKSMNITGRWMESTPRLVGVLDDNDMIDPITNTRFISLVYALHLSSKNSVNEGYKWVHINELENVCKNDISKNIIRYAGTSI